MYQNMLGKGQNTNFSSACSYDGFHPRQVSYTLFSHCSYSCLENLMDGAAWWAKIHGVATLT